MRRRFSTLLLASTVLAVLFACAEPETHPDALRTSSGEPRFRDGLYSTAFTHPDQAGWRPFLLVEIEGGLLTSVCFDAVDEQGIRLRESDRIIAELRLQGVDLSAVLTRFEENVIRTQTEPGVIEPRAAEWGIYLELLLREALAIAEQGPPPGGRTAAQQSPVLVPMQGPYLVTDTPDALGWRAELVTVHDATGVVAAHYAEVRRGSGGIERKREDSLYEQEYGQARGVRFSAAADELARGILDTDPQTGGPAEAVVHAVGGATLTSARFSLLTARLAALRASVNLPRRICR